MELKVIILGSRPIQLVRKVLAARLLVTLQIECRESKVKIIKIALDNLTTVR